MKFIAFIFFFLVAFFTVQPLISSQQAAPAAASCPKMMKCHSQKQSKKDKGNCDSDGCNPFMACANCNFYLVEKGGFTFLSIVPEQEKKVAVNDNRLSTWLSESWHPPEGEALYIS